MKDKVQDIKDWLGSGSINIFGKPFSGKDTVGKQLAEALDAEFLSSGDIIRAARDNANAEIAAAARVSDGGAWMPTDEFRDLVLPYLYDEKLTGRALVLSMIGRWIGEEQPVMDALERGDHDTKAVLLLDVSEDEIWRRWELAKDPNSRNEGRADDSDRMKVQRRLYDYDDKTLPVIDIYHQKGILLEIAGEMPRDDVFTQVIDKLHDFIQH